MLGVGEGAEVKQWASREKKVVVVNGRDEQGMNRCVLGIEGILLCCCKGRELTRFGNCLGVEMKGESSHALSLLYRAGSDVNEDIQGKGGLGWAWEDEKFCLGILRQ